MSTVEARCPLCSSRVRLAPSAITITVPPRKGVPGRCEFTCPDCGGGLWVSLDPDQAVLLVSRGTPLSPEARARLRHPTGRGGLVPKHPDGPPLTFDDVLDFHELLERDDWYDELLALTL